MAPILTRCSDQFVQSPRCLRVAKRPFCLDLVFMVAVASTLTWLAVVGCTPDTRLTVNEFLAEAEPQQLTDDPSDPAFTPAEPPPAPWHEEPYKVGDEDVLAVRIAGLEAVGLPAEYTVRVSSEGQIMLPSVGSVPVAGLTIDQIESKLLALYSPEHIRNTQVTVQLVQAALKDVSVMGDVVQPRTVQLPRDRLTVLHALLAAGGPMEFGGRVNLIPAANPEQVVQFDLSSPHDLAQAARVGSVSPSDILIVDGRPNNAVFVYGLVNMPGPQPLPRSSRLTVLQAVAAAGGPMLQFEPKEITLIRHKPNGQLLRAKLDLDRTMRGEDPDVTLAAGDLLIVPHTAGTRAEEFIAGNLVTQFGINATFNPWGHYYFRQDQKTRRSQNSSVIDTFGRQLLFSGSNLLMPPVTPATP